MHILDSLLGEGNWFTVDSKMVLYGASLNWHKAGVCAWSAFVAVSSGRCVPDPD